MVNERGQPIENETMSISLALYGVRTIDDTDYAWCSVHLADADNVSNNWLSDCYLSSLLCLNEKSV